MKKGLLLVFSFFISINFLFSENWILSATQFSIQESATITEAEKSGLEIVSTQLPSLILDSFSMNVNRTVFPEEVFERDLYKIKKNRQSLYTNLTNQIKTRDTLLFTYEGLELDKKIESSEKTIKSTIEKIEESEEEEILLTKNFNSNKKKFPVVASVVLYQNDSTKLFNSEDSSSIEKINSASINGLITGKIIPYGNYVKVESTLTLYPEGKVIATAKEVGLVSEVEFIANSIINQFLSSIINEELVQADILIYPPEAGENAIIYIEDYVLRGKSVSAKFAPGEHSIRVESPGYETIYFSQTYLPRQNKTISINMKKIDEVQTYFTIKDKKNKSQYELSSQIFLNSNFVGNSPISILITDKTYLGEIVSNSNEDLYSFFVLKNGYNSSFAKGLDENSNMDSVTLQVKIPEAKIDLSKKIDKSRKRMYWSYGGLILTLPVLYFAKGNYELCQENSSIVNPNALQTWKKVSDVSTYVSIGAGVNFLVQLILYLVDANRVVPKTIKPELINSEDSEKLNLIIQETRQVEEKTKLEKELKEKEEMEKAKLLEDEKNNLDENLEVTDEEVTENIPEQILDATQTSEIIKNEEGE